MELQSKPRGELVITYKSSKTDTVSSRRTYSLRQRLLIWLLAPLFIIGLVALFDAYKSARITADNISDRVLAGSALAIAERIFVNDEGKLEVDIPYVALEMLTSAEDDRVFYKIESAEGDFITGYRLLQIPSRYLRRENNINFTDFKFRKFPIRIAVLEGAASSNILSLDYRLAVAETTNARSKMARDILIRSAIRQGLLIFTAAIAVWFAVTRALGPLYKVQDAIGRRSSDDLRPILHNVPKEVEGLVATTNDLLKRIATSISALRNFTSNASHQLRTPLTVMRTQIEIANRAKSAATRKTAIAHADEAVSDAENVIAKLLIMARIDSASIQDLSTYECDIAETCKLVCSEFISSTNFRDIDLGYEGPDNMKVSGDPILFREMLRNLVDNAIKYGGKYAQITVRCKRIDAKFSIEVEDNGIGLSEMQKIDLMKRFSRGAENKDGTGVGLTIARDIAELFGGKLQLEDRSNETGLRVSVNLVGAGPDYL